MWDQNLADRTSISGRLTVCCDLLPIPRCRLLCVETQEAAGDRARLRYGTWLNRYVCPALALGRSTLVHIGWVAMWALEGREVLQHCVRDLL